MKTINKLPTIDDRVAQLEKILGTNDTSSHVYHLARRELTGINKMREEVIRNYENMGWVEFQYYLGHLEVKE